LGFVRFHWNDLIVFVDKIEKRLNQINTHLKYAIIAPAIAGCARCHRHSWRGSNAE
jgi:hypothetical protein